ncbi:MAG: hypothetical protein IR527_00880 [Bacteroides sp.]|nr:MAG: hypothetical protein IR527_00880 [Bacteroides sp.]
MKIIKIINNFNYIYKILLIIMLKKIRVRFAPSTTGPFHIGGLRTALYNYLFAKKYNGDFILRFENTDINRYDENSEKHIKDSLKWCNINIDFLQKTKKELYQYYIEYLLKHGYAYYGFDTEKDLKQNNSKFEKYGIKNRLKMKNSLTVSSDETDFIIKNYNYVVRLKIPYLEKEYIYKR